MRVFILLLTISVLAKSPLRAEVYPYLKLYDAYGELINDPIYHGNEVLLTYKKIEGEKIHYTLMRIDGSKYHTITNFPLEPIPWRMEEISKKEGFKIPPQAKLYFTGFCTRFQDKTLVGFTASEIKKNSLTLGEYIFEYKNGEFVEYLFTDTKMGLYERIENAKASGMDMKSEEAYDAIMQTHFSAFGDILFHSDDALVMRATVDGKKGYYSYDGKEFTFFHKLPDTYKIGTKSVNDNDFVYTVQSDGKLFSLVQDVKMESESRQKIVSKDLYVYDLQTKQQTLIQHEELFSYQNDGEAGVQWRYSKGENADMEDARTALTVLGDMVFYSALLKNQPAKYDAKDGEKRGLFIYAKGRFEKLPIQNTTDHLLGCISVLNGMMVLVARGEEDPLVDAKISKGYIKSPFPGVQPRPMQIAGHRFTLIPWSYPMVVGGKQIFHYRNHVGSDTHFAYDGEKFELYTGFQSINKGGDNLQGFPRHMFTVGGKTFIFLKGKKTVDQYNNVHYKTVLSEWWDKEGDFRDVSY